MAEFEVARSQGVCAASGRRLEEGETFYAVLLERSEGFVRQDYAENAWDGPPEDAMCFWKAQVPQRDQKRQVIVSNDVLIDFFERLADEDEPHKQQFRFVLALMLMRKRLLRYEETTHTDEVETWSMTLTTDQSRHAVVNPQLQDDEIDAVSEQLTAILHGDFLADFGEKLEASTARTEPSPETADGEPEAPRADA